MAAKFEITKDVSGEFRFKLVAANGQTVAVSQGYKDKAGALNGIKSIKETAVKAAIEDKTV
jgi:uncharacterized protein YegP (UPF0339 family)